MRAVMAKCMGRPSNRCRELDVVLETPRRRDRLERSDDTIRTTLSYPSDGYGPRARKGSPCGNTGCYRRRNGERELQQWKKRIPSIWLWFPPSVSRAVSRLPSRLPKVSCRSQCSFRCVLGSLTFLFNIYSVIFIVFSYSLWCSDLSER